MRTTENVWTIVSRDKGGHFFRPVDGAEELSWHEASAIGRLLSAELNADEELVSVWVTVDERVEGALALEAEEDRGNVLEDSDRHPHGRRVPIRWDAAPRHSLDTVEDDVALPYSFGGDPIAIRTLAELRAERGRTPVVVETRVELLELIPGQTVAVVLYYGDQMVGNRCAMVGGMSDEERAARIRETAEKLAAHVGVELTEEAAA